MTTLEDTTYCLLNDPLNPALHHAVVDRITEEADDPRRELLDFLIAHRDNDGPRLAFACRCEANGEGERAEFIRVQVERSRIPEQEVGKDPLDCVCPEQAHLISERCEPCRRRFNLKRLEIGLLNELHASGLVRNQIDWLGAAAMCYDISNRNPYEFRRGFLYSITATAADWLAHADAILSEHPVEKVRLTTVPQLEYRSLAVNPPIPQCRIRGRGLWRSQTASPDYRATVLDLLRAEFPGIEFVFPVISGAHGTVTVGGVTIPINSWSIAPPLPSE